MVIKVFPPRPKQRGKEWVCHPVHTTDAHPTLYHSPLLPKHMSTVMLPPIPLANTAPCPGSEVRSGALQLTPTLHTLHHAIRYRVGL